ncbi:hypothetical protein T4A_5397 [Trichinella pseudospiralis]|uniref:Uncharacterized protein n=1 Tax=Trichinella pseudospiralis TaxID=6337 RepID=A0A0V1EHH0_TRIPS|nr:hypothetical protein T4A_5397 [Trichinella pseudospiralis]
MHIHIPLSSYLHDFSDRWRITLNSAISTSNSSQMSLICVYMVGPSTKQDRSVKQLSAVEKQVATSTSLAISTIQNLWGWMLCIFSLLLYIQNVEQMYQVSSSSKKPIVVLEGGKEIFICISLLSADDLSQMIVACMDTSSLVSVLVWLQLASTMMHHAVFVFAVLNSIFFFFEMNNNGIITLKRNDASIDESASDEFA